MWYAVEALYKSSFSYDVVTFVVFLPEDLSSKELEDCILEIAKKSENHDEVNEQGEPVPYELVEISEVHPSYRSNIEGEEWIVVKMFVDREFTKRLIDEAIEEGCFGPPETLGRPELREFRGKIQLTIEPLQHRELAKRANDADQGISDFIVSQLKLNL